MFGFRFRFSSLLSYLHHVERTGVNVEKVISLVKFAVNFCKIFFKRENSTISLFRFKFLVELCENILLFFGNMTEILFIPKSSICFRNRGKFISKWLLEFSVRLRNFCVTYECMCHNSQIPFDSAINFILVSNCFGFTLSKYLIFDV